MLKPTVPSSTAQISRGFTAVLVLAIGLQLILSWLFVARVSYFVKDDLAAIALANNSNLITNMQMRIDVHWVPLVRASTYALHKLAPMNFPVAILFLLACHALTMVVLYQLLQKIHRSSVNAWLIVMYAFNATVFSPLHWFAAGVHRFPFILLAVISCYAFVCFLESRRISTAATAAVTAILATGFFIKAILIPVYWAAFLFCVMDFRQWRNHRAEYLLIAATTMFFVIYLGWYLHTSVAQLEPTFDIGSLLSSLSVGFRVAAQMPLQIPFMPVPPGTMPTAWGLLLGSLCWLNRKAWRSIAALLGILTLNILLLAASQRAAALGAFAMLVTRYYFELLFPMTLFASLALRELKYPHRRDTEQLSTTKPALSKRRIWYATQLGALVIYAATGWYSAINYLHIGPEEKSWQSAQFERTLRTELAKFDAHRDTLADGYIPQSFDSFFSTRIKLSDYLAWHELNLRFDVLGKATHYVTDQGYIMPTDTREESR